MVTAEESGDAFVLEVRNGIAGPVSPAPGGMGLRLAALDAIEHGGVLEFGPAEGAAWRVRLVLALDERGSA